MVAGWQSPQRLLYFVRIAEAGSLTLAAEGLNMRQATLSTALRKLEDELGVVLFARGGRGVSLTTEGERLFTQAQLVLRSLDDLSEVAHGLNSDAYGTVSVAATAGVSASLLGPIARRFTTAFPESRLLIVRTYGLTDTLDALRLGRTELAFLPRLSVPDGLGGVRIGEYELGLAVPPGVRLPAGDVELSWLDGLAMVSSQPGTVADRLIAAAARLGAHPRVVMVEAEMAALPRLVALGVGAAIVTTAQRAELRALGVELRRFAPRERWPVRLVHREATISPTARRLLAVAQEPVGSTS